MTLTVHLAPELVAEPQAMAQEAGLDPDHYIARTLEEHVQRHQHEPATEATRERFLQQLRAWRQGDPEEQCREWQQLEEVLKEERLRPNAVEIREERRPARG